MCVKLIIGAIAGLLGGMPVLAHADDGGDDPFSLDYTAPSERLKPTPESDQAVADALVALSAVTDLPAGERKAIDAELAEVAVRSPKIAKQARDDIQSQNQRKAQVQTQGQGISPLATNPDIPTLKYLNVSHQAQKNSYYCGPATASMILKWRGKSMSQSKLAGKEYLKTDDEGATRWTKKVMAPTLNGVLKGTRYRTLQSPSLSVLKGTFINTIGDGYPIAIDTVEYPNGAHYNNHPNRSTVIGHWIVGRGHESDAKTLKFLDPANELWKQYGTKASFSQSASSFHKYVTTNGIVG